MLGLLITLVFTVAVTLGIRGLLGAFLKDLDPAEKIGVSGLLGLGAAGLFTFFVGITPQGLRWGGYVLIAIVFALLFAGYRRIDNWRIKTKPGGLLALIPLIIGVLILVPLLNALAPSGPMDWDTLAYHLALPKLWLELGQIERIPFIHHSNFPCGVDGLFIWGLWWGGEAGAKSFTLAFLLVGLVLVFGASRRLFGGYAAWLSSLALVATPLILWESGSGYIDVANGLFAAGGIFYASESLCGDRRKMILAGLLLGFAAASKYTGLQIIASVGLTLLLFQLFSRKQGKCDLTMPIVVTVLALIVASPFYVRNAILTGNPVTPFFYKILGGKDWDDWRADIYQNEQKSFGVATNLPPAQALLQFPHALLGLAYQPGRYINPGQTHGQGFPMGAIGFVPLVSGLCVLLLCKRRTQDAFIFLTLSISLLMWFFLSQQSRYVIGLFIPLILLLGRAMETRPIKAVIIAGISFQTIYTLWLLLNVQTTHQIPVVLGMQTRDSYLSAQSPFYRATKEINRIVDTGRVALFDEVFGYYLDVPYFWANPGHSTLLPSEKMSSGKELIEGMRYLGITHVYINTSQQYLDKSFALPWLHSLGVGDQLKPLDEASLKTLSDDPQSRWRALISEAVLEGEMHLIKSFSKDQYSWPSGILFTIAPKKHP